MTVYAAVRAAQQSFAEAGIASAETDAVTLAAFALGSDAADVRRRMVLRDPAGAAFRDRYEALVAEREARIPLQHLTGRAPFRRLELEVGPGVFVPRPETEVVAGLAIDVARALSKTLGRPAVVVDLCTGSGAIALAVKDELPDAIVHAVELSPEAHAWALRNIEQSGLDVKLVLGDAVTALPELEAQVDVVVSNPPYIPSGAAPLDPEVRDHDPAVALFGLSEDGLALPRLVAARSAALLRPGGVLVMEHGEFQGEALSAALTRAGCWSHLDTRTDLTGRPRAVSAVRG